jgi:hypothetical protein
MRTRFPSAKAAAARTSGLAGIVKRIGIDRYEKQPRVKVQALCGPTFLQRIPAEKAQNSGRDYGRL